jgi:uncharacterized protein (DUF58 family)
VSALVVGIASGTVGVVVARAAFGPGTGLAGAAIGLVVGIPVSLWAGSVGRGRAPRLPNGHRLRRRAHPVAWLGPVFGSLITVLAWSGVAHSSGSGWVQAVGALLAAVLVTGLVAPLFPALRARATCTANPSDAVAGQPVVVTLSASGPLRIRPLFPVGASARAEGRSRGPRQVDVEVVPARRGVLGSVALELASSAPFGLVWWGREVVVPLARPLHVAPRVGPHQPVEAGTDDRAGDAYRRLPTTVGEVRGIRPYRAGDLRRAIHWPATAHTGTLMVSEAERQVDDPVVVDVELPPDPDAAERAAERAMAATSDHLARGVPVLLVTREAGGRVARPVVDRVELGRRLARAVPPPAPAAPAGRSRRARSRP